MVGLITGLGGEGGGSGWPKKWPENARKLARKITKQGHCSVGRRGLSVILRAFSASLTRHMRYVLY